MSTPLLGASATAAAGPGIVTPWNGWSESRTAPARGRSGRAWAGPRCCSGPPSPPASPSLGAEPGYPYLTFFAAVLLAAVLFGRRVGLLATAAATALALWFFVAPVGGLRVEDPRDAWAALAFAATGLAFVLLASAARRALRERDRANAALRLVLEGIGEPFYVLDADWRFVHASRAALQAWGKAAPEVLGRRYLDAFPEAAGGPIHAAHEEAMRTRRPARLEAVSPVLGRWVEVDIHPDARKAACRWPSAISTGGGWPRSASACWWPN